MKYNLDRDVYRKKKTVINLGDKQYSLAEVIGEGTYSKVCRGILKCPEKKDITIACKIINKIENCKGFTEKFLPREISILRKVRHQHIVVMLDVVDIGAYVYMFMEFCPGGDLLEYILSKGRLSIKRSRHIFRQICEAVEYLHNLEISHRDLKCENVLLTANRNVRLADFGFARFCRNPDTNTKILSNTFCGSAAYAAPEILKGISYYPKMYDIWSLGCILYIMLCGTMPFDDSNIQKMLKFQQNKVIYFSICYNADLARSLQRLLCGLLEPDVTKRLTINKILDSDWLKKNNSAHRPKRRSKDKISNKSSLKIM